MLHHDHTLVGIVGKIPAFTQQLALIVLNDLLRDGCQAHRTHIPQINVHIAVRNGKHRHIRLPLRKIRLCFGHKGSVSRFLS